MTTLTRTDIDHALGVLGIWPVTDPAARATIATALREAAARAARPYVFALGRRLGEWLVGPLGEHRIVHSDLRGLLAAWEAMSNSGVDTYSHTLEDDSEVAVTALRNAIRVAGVKWAERNGLRWLASAFLCIRVERGQMFYEPGLGAAEIVFELPA